MTDAVTNIDVVKYTSLKKIFDYVRTYCTNYDLRDEYEHHIGNTGKSSSFYDANVGQGSANPSDPTQRR